jgi:hypothetical protein
MESPSAPSSVVVTRRPLDAERLPRVDILRKKPTLPLPELESGISVLDADRDEGGCCCCGRCWGEDCKKRLGVGDALRIDRAPFAFVLSLGDGEGALEEEEEGRGG